VALRALKELFWLDLEDSDATAAHVFSLGFVPRLRIVKFGGTRAYQELRPLVGGEVAAGDCCCEMWMHLRKVIAHFHLQDVPRDDDGSVTQVWQSEYLSTSPTWQPLTPHELRQARQSDFLTYAPFYL
jgi:hypothetical protein